MTIALLIGVSAASKLIFGCSFACPYNDAPAEGTDGFTFWWTAYYITLILTLVSKYTDLLWIYIYGEAVIEKKSELESTNATSETQRAQSKSKTNAYAFKIRCSLLTLTILCTLVGVFY